MTHGIGVASIREGLAPATLLVRLRELGCGLTARKRGRMKGFPDRTAGRLAAGLLVLCAVFPAGASEEAHGFFSLRVATVRAFQAYVAGTESQNNESLGRGPFLWVDGLPESERKAALARLLRGEVEIERVGGSKGRGNAETPGGMIHDWKGIVFVPGANLGDVLKVLEDYDHQSIYYTPDVERSKIESHNGDHYRVFLRFRRHKIVTAVIDTEHEVTYYRDSATREHSRSSAVRIAEVEDAGSPEEKEKMPGEDAGYLWGMETWWRMEERDGGVYVQNQVVTLTRDIPTGLGWLIEPFITSIPRETLEFTLEATRKAVLVKMKG